MHNTTLWETPIIYIVQFVYVIMTMIVVPAANLDQEIIPPTIGHMN